jgi:catechol 2,3-dioxygenase-like lactoylglutathione lyase family enzyme
MEFTLHASLPASDIDRARAWYSEKLGLVPIESGPGGELRYDTGATQFGVYPSAFAGSNQATAAVLVVGDFDAARAELLSKGVVFEDYDFGEEFRTVDGVMETPDGLKTSWFKDSEGNILALGAM